MNALLATCAIKVAGYDAKIFVSKLAEIGGIKGRLNSHDINQQLTLIDDSYNANPTSLKAAIDLLSQYQNKKYLVLGDMAELGQSERELHAECGRYAFAKGIDALYSVGELSKLATQAFLSSKNEAETATHTKTYAFDNQADLNATLNRDISEGVVLIKGSRSAQMEWVVKEFLQANSIIKNKKEGCL